MLFWIIVGLVLLSLLTFAIKKEFTITFDTKILDWFHIKENVFLDLFFSLITWLGSLWVLVPLSLALVSGLLFYGYSTISLIFMLGFIGAITSIYAIKFALERDRPKLFDAMGNMPLDPSYPSAHTTQAFAFALMLGIVTYILDSSYKLPLLMLYLSLATLVAISRVYMQVHFPSDVLAGALVSLIWIGFILYLFKLGTFQ